ncbi:hypothetical protein [uncultured Amnibacterium sp.]|uniref:hypothetical protein n=1 Tax=uncultured Amnibacterium sp. TaxID=1631851 RepID=UPI0035CC23B0
MRTELVLPSRAALLAALRPQLTGPAWTLLIDGGSGSGKTTLAAWLAPRLQAEVLAMEVLYPGWSGLAAAADLLATRVLPARAAGRVVAWREWDWAARAPGRPVLLHPGRPLIVEGCGALTPRSRPFATVALLLQVDDGLRARRAERRDPHTRQGRLAAWRDDERRVQARRPPVADLLLRGGVASVGID